MKSYWNAMEGRLLLTAIGILFASGGLGALLGVTSVGIGVTCIGTLAAVVCTIFAAGLVTKENLRYSIYICSVMPTLLFLFVLGQGLAMRGAQSVGYGILAVGLLVLSRAFFGPKVESIEMQREHAAHA